ncbi:MAG: sugar ABC transporter ATP-binding protein [Phyllobacterium sp.]
MLLEMRNIRKSFANVQVLHSIDFSLKPGEIHALVGHNGAGKSTLMKILGGNFSDYDGEILFAGETVQLRSPKEALQRGVAIIYQDFSLVPELTVAENIALGREPKGILRGTVAHAEIRKRSAAETEALGISLPMDRPVRTLGVGGQQLTEIVRACSKDVRILVMDEPTSRLAPAERELLFATMRRMANERHVGIVYISHFLDEVCRLADRITLMRDGRVVETGPGNGYTVERLAEVLVGQEISESTSSAASQSPQPGSEALAAIGLAVHGRPPVDFAIRKGEIIGLAGLVGSGRTRLARALMGDVRFCGTIAIGGRKFGRLTPEKATRQGLALVPEDRKITGLALGASVEANISVSALGKFMSVAGIVRPGSRRRLAEDMIKRFVIRPPDRKKVVGNLSGGNAQKVLLARAVGSQPVALILDQPTAGVDIGAKAELHKQIRLAAQQGTGVLVISDDLDELIELSDNVLVLNAGAITGRYRKEELTSATLLTAISRARPS